jgi:hypothetical protein
MRLFIFELMKYEILHDIFQGMIFQVYLQLISSRKSFFNNLINFTLVHQVLQLARGNGTKLRFRIFADDEHSRFLFYPRWAT